MTGALGGLRLGFVVQLVAAGAAGLAVAFGLATLMRVPEVTYALGVAKRAFARLIPGAGGSEA